MRRENERGAGRLANAVWLLIAIAVGYVLWNVLPVYLANWGFKDRMVEVARLPRRGNTEQRLRELLMQDARERGIGEYLSQCDIRILESKRQIICEYQRDVPVFPGYTRTFHFVNEVEEPFF